MFYYSLLTISEVLSIFFMHGARSGTYMKLNKSISSENHDVDPWIKDSLLFREWDQIKNEILDHKWYESEKAGYDIGWERASVDWLIRFGHRRKS